MANYMCEMFGYVYYSDILTYEALLRREKYILNDFRLVLLEHDAVHINNIPSGDTLLVQCSFSAYDDDLIEGVCEDLHSVLCENVYCKLLFVDKTLDYMHVCSLTHLGWTEAPLHFPIVPNSLLSGKLSEEKENISLNNACKFNDSRIDSAPSNELDSDEVTETSLEADKADDNLDESNEK